VLPDHVLREDEMVEMLPLIAGMVGHKAPIAPGECLADTPFALDEIYDDELEALAEKVYQRDYMLFGFGPWEPIN